MDLLPRHARVSGNERANRLANTADITSDPQLGKAEVLRADEPNTADITSDLQLGKAEVLRG